MAGGNDEQIDGAIGPGIAEVMEKTASHGAATGAVTAASARSRRPVATATLEACLGQVFRPE